LTLWSEALRAQKTPSWLVHASLAPGVFCTASLAPGFSPSSTHPVIAVTLFAQINDLFKGTLHDFVRCVECGAERKRTDTFLDLSLVIKPFGSDKAVGSVEEALDDFVKQETLDGDNKVECERCAKRTNSVKGLDIAQPPYLLQLSLKR